MQGIIDFILAALPWVAIALTLAIVGTKHKSIREDKNKSLKEKKADENSMSLGMTIGVCIGVSIGSSLQNKLGGNWLVIGISVGMLVGSIIGMNVKK